jgi:putative endonuclease
MVRVGSVYILTNKYRTTLYVGVTSNLLARTLEHKNKVYPSSFSARYNLTVLVYYEHHPSIEEAIAREKYIKRKVRRWKDDLIRSMNPEWRDLYEDILH